MTEYKIDFLKYRKIFGALSAALILISIISMVVHHPPLRPGLEFTGGTQLRVEFPEQVPTSDVRAALAAINIPGVDLSASIVQDFPDLERQGKYVKTITMKIFKEDQINLVVKKLQEQFPGMEVLSREVISGQVSREIQEKAWQAILIALIVMLVYIAWRFQLRFAVGAVAALVHDVTITVGIFSLFRIEVGLAVIAALLTIIGYSLNDTIIIFDRVRENLGAQFKRRRKIDYYEVINRSANQTLSRTIQTSLTTFIPVVILAIFGGSVLRPFAIALTIGVVVGTYSSIYIADAIVYYWSLKAEAVRSRSRVRAH